MKGVKFAVDSSVWIEAEKSTTYAKGLAGALESMRAQGALLVMPTLVMAEADIPETLPVGTFLNFDEEAAREAASIRRAVIQARKGLDDGPSGQCLRVDALILAVCLANDVRCLIVRDDDYQKLIDAAGLAGRMLIHDTSGGDFIPAPLLESG